MISIKNFVFNAFQVNTYVLYDETKECIILDAACSTVAEQNKLFGFIATEGLRPKCLLSTHAHVDHILGNKVVLEKYAIPYQIHAAGKQFLYTSVEHGQSFGLEVQASPMPDRFIEENELITFGNSSLKALYVPGHADGSLCFYAEEEGYLFSGDVLFSGSVGRSDLPTGDHELLIKGIRSQLMSLPADTRVYPGHGQETTIGFEKENNPFF